MTTQVKGDQVIFDEGAAASTPAAAKVTVYAKSDGLMYSKDDACVETLMSGGAPGMSSFNLAGDSGTPQAITNGNTATIAGGTGLSSVAAATDTVTLNLDNTAVTPASYTNTNLTVDAQGRITAASNGAVQFDVNNFRLSLTTGVPVTTSDVTAAGTLYYMPAGSGNRIGLYNGSGWDVISSAEVSLALTITDATNYDIFAYNNAGTLTLELTAWTNATTRATALTTQDGVYVKTGALTRRFIGTLRASGTNTTEDSVSKRFLMNFYNQEVRPLRFTPGTNSWSCASATLQQWNADAASKVELLMPLDRSIKANLQVVANASATGAFVATIGLDGTTTATGCLTGFIGTNLLNSAGCVWNGYPGLGYHYLTALEASTAGTATVYGDNGNSNILQSGLAAEVMG